MGRKSQFTLAQDAHIESYMTAFDAKVHELDPEFKRLKVASLTRWKQETAETIKSSPLFKDQLPCDTDVTLTKWTERIIRKFTNRFSSQKSKHLLSQSHASGDQYFIKLSSHITGRQLYELEHKDEINAEATARRNDANQGGGHAGFYQEVLKEMWDAEEEQEAYEKRAEEAASDIYQNQQGFVTSAFGALKTLCQNGKLGPAEMLLLYAFRDEHGDLDSGVINAHSVDNNLSLMSQYDDFAEHVETPWAQFTEKVLPRPAPKTNELAGVDIPSNSEGIPLFPSVDIDNVALKQIRSVLEKYFKTLWGHTWPPDQQIAAIPWADISGHPSDYYDSERFVIPIKLQAPELLSSTHIVTLAEYLAAMDTDEPFVFHQKEDICRRSSVRQAEEDAERTAGAENIEEVTEPTASDEDIEEADMEPTSKAADRHQQTGSIAGDKKKERPSFGDSGSDSGAKEIMVDDIASKTSVSGDDALGDSGRDVGENATLENCGSKEVVSEHGRNDEDFTDRTASEGEQSKGERSEDSDSDESGGPVSTRGRGAGGSKTRGRGGHVGVANVSRTTRSAAANTSVGPSTRGTKRKVEDNQEKPARGKGNVTYGRKKRNTRKR